MTKNGLRTGMRVKMRDGKYFIVYLEFGIEGQFAGKNSWGTLGNYDNRLMHLSNKSFDIVEVAEARKITSLMRSNLEDDQEWRILWIRQEKHIVSFDGGDPIEISEESFQNFVKHFTKDKK